LAGPIYPPSYLSLHWALGFYGLIPEQVVTLTSVPGVLTGIQNGTIGYSMKTTLDIPENQLKELMSSGKFSSKKEAVNTAIEAYLQERRIARLLEAAGTSEDFMTREDLEEFRKDG